MKFKKLLKYSAAALCAGAVVFGAGCSSGKSTLLGKAAEAYTVSYSTRQEDTYKSVQSSAEGFAAEFAEVVYKSGYSGNNLAVSPVSVYMALALASECADGDTKTQLLAALGVDEQTLSEGFADFYCSLINEATTNTGDLKSRLALTNSIWVNEGTSVKDDCITSLAEKYYCYSYAADFAHDNASANKAIRSFVKEHTYGVIDRDFNLSTETLFTLINTLYLKDVWNSYGNDLPYTDSKYDFENTDGSTTSQKLLRGYYNNGKVQSGENYTFFYTTTNSGYKIKFMVPDDGYTVDDIFTAENIEYMNSVTDYGYADTVNKIHYHTRCYFPEFTASYDNDVAEILCEYFGVQDFFNANNCNFSNLTDEPVYCSAVRHVANLEVNKKGVEGAAVTVVAIDGSAAPGEEEAYEEVYENFIVDKAFAYVVTDSYNVTLFSGVVNKV